MLKTAGPGCIAGDLVEIRRLGAKIHAAVQADETYRMPSSIGACSAPPSSIYTAMGLVVSDDRDGCGGSTPGKSFGCLHSAELADIHFTVVTSTKIVTESSIKL
jgi:hypothetical protein